MLIHYVLNELGRFLNSAVLRLAFSSPFWNLEAGRRMLEDQKQGLGYGNATLSALAPVGKCWQQSSHT
jgi:hypothetical protein